MSEPSTTPGHVPVLLAETVALLLPRPGALIADACFGGGGHARELLAAGADVFALDKDPEAIARSQPIAAEFPGRFTAIASDFRDLKSALEQRGIVALDGLLLDLGVSSWQLDTPERGFSFRTDGPLDMRMNPDSGSSAADFVNELDAGELVRIFRQYGEEPSARRIAAAIVRHRETSPFRTTLDLASLVESVIPRHGKTHPATRVFQALRIAVNDELGALEQLLADAPSLLGPGGRLAIITFHSLEDRIVKRYLRQTSAATIDRPEWPQAKPNPERYFDLLTPHPVIPSEEEIARNPRARSAKLRGAERRADDGL